MNDRNPTNYLHRAAPSRIACVYLPSFELQARVRRTPHLENGTFAIVSDSGPPSISICTKAAWAAGVRPRMNALQARGLVPNLATVPSDEALYHESLTSLADALLEVSPTIDLGHAESNHHVLYVGVPKGARGDTFASKLFATLQRFGYRSRIGIADDRFTAWVAARLSSNSEQWINVARGCAAAFLAQKDISLLPMSEDLLHTLKALGIGTMGAFAALPPPSIGQGWNCNGHDYQALARGDGPTQLHLYSPTGSVCERLELPEPVNEVEPLLFMLRPLADRTAARLRGREASANRAFIRLSNSAGRNTNCSVRVRHVLSASELRDACHEALCNLRDRLSVEFIELVIEEFSEVDSGELSLFDECDSSKTRSSRSSPIARSQRTQLQSPIHGRSGFRSKPTRPARRTQHHRSMRQTTKHAGPCQGVLPFASDTQRKRLRELSK